MIVAAADAVAELDTCRLTAATVITRAGVSPHEFHATFGSLEECLLAAFDEGLARLTRAVAGAIPPNARMPAKVEAGLTALLAFLDDEPGWGRLLLIELPVQAEPRRARAVTRLASRIGDIEDWPVNDPHPPVSRVDTAWLIKEVLGVIARQMDKGGPGRLARQMDKGGPGRLLTLAPGLMSRLIEPKLGWGGEVSRSGAEVSRAGAEDTTGRTARTQRALRAIARRPGANNRQIAQASGVPNDSNTSAHLRLLERHGLIRNLTQGGARGQANAWVLTEAGRGTLFGTPCPEVACGTVAA